MDQDGTVSLNRPTQYASDGNLRARQRLWEHQQPRFDLVSWVLELAGLSPGSTNRVLDVGCGNGLYLAQLRLWSITTIGCDLSQGMLASARATEQNLVNADVTRLPFPSSVFDVVLAPHMLYHVADRAAAALEMRRVTRPGGRCVVVTNGVEHMRSLRSLVESAVRAATPGWDMRDPSTRTFSLDNGEDQLRSAFTEVTRCSRHRCGASRSHRRCGRRRLRGERQGSLPSGDHSAVVGGRRRRAQVGARTDRCERFVRRPGPKRRIHLQLTQPLKPAAGLRDAAVGPWCSAPGAEEYVISGAEVCGLPRCATAAGASSARPHYRWTPRR